MLKILFAAGVVVFLAFPVHAQSVGRQLPSDLPDASSLGSDSVPSSAESSPETDPSFRPFRPLVGGYARLSLGLVDSGSSTFSRDFSFPGTLSGLPTGSGNDYSVSEWHPAAASTLAIGGQFPGVKPFSVGAGARLGILLAGFSYSQQASALSWSVSGRVPDPLRRGRMHPVPAASLSAPAEYRVIQLDFGVSVPVGRFLEIAALAGPAFHSLSYTAPSDLRFPFAYPFERVGSSAVVTRTLSESTADFHAGVDIGYYPARYLGFGVLLGYRPLATVVRVRDATASIGSSDIVVQAGARVRF